MTWTAFGCGVVVGVVLGIFILSLCIAAKRGDDCGTCIHYRD